MIGKRNPAWMQSVATACLLTGLLVGLPQSAQAQWPDSFTLDPAWQTPSVDRVKADALAWLETTSPDESVRSEAESIWANAAAQPTGAELLDRLTKTFALADANARDLLRQCSQQTRPTVLPSQPWLTDTATAPLVAANMQLFYGRYLTQASLYDEAYEQLAGLTAEDVVAPATLLFYQGIVHHGLLQKQDGLNAVGRLLEGAEQSPRRYVAVAEMIRRDLEALQDDTLDHIARRMDDIRRRLELARAGSRVREVEDGVIESLDKMIKEIEEKQKKKKGGGSSASKSPQPNKPAPDSRILQGKGPGNVQKRSIGSEADWGDLPAKEREEALQQMGREFPSHYRDIIEQYFRRLASEGSE
ncbi:MAG TPA: hypothetical protein VE890_05910 [Thermoguttaceae bacterium]|nr:hypothetical protein [Thermoguttaceae bacterium]